MPGAHSKFSPSSASRWLRCPGSISLVALAPPEEFSPYAQEGTDAHELAELYLRDITDLEGEHDWPNYSNRVNELANTYDMSEMEPYVQSYAEAILERAQDGELHIEVQVNFASAIGLPAGSDEAFGTADAVIVFDEHLEVHDLKYGKGIAVSPVENEQLMVYALGALDQFDILGEIETVTMGIHQVRLGEPQYWECSVDDLRDFAEKLKVAANDALSEAPTFVAGETQCRWCKAKAICQHAAAQANEITSPADPGEFADLTVEERVKAMSVEQFEGYYAKLKFVEDWAKAMHARGHAEAMAGTLQNYKAVSGRAGARAWKDGEEAERVMKSMRLKLDEMYSRKILTPPQAEKLLAKDSPKRWARLASLITQPEGKPIVVPIDDKRKAITDQADAEEFDDLDLTADDDLA